MGWLVVFSLVPAGAGGVDFRRRPVRAGTLDPADVLRIARLVSSRMGWMGVSENVYALPSPPFSRHDSRER
jgi:hypothetical protein